MAGLSAVLRARIAAAGPITVGEYMAVCLSHPQFGYYMRRDPIGSGGDFTTAPEISQMFGELIGAWCAQVWTDMGRPAPFALVEFGPGRGTLMADALRALGKLGVAAPEIWLIETSPVLRARQAEALSGFAPRWAANPGELPQAPAIFIANEFFDALPVRQFQRADAFWRERLVGLEAGELRFVWGAPRPHAEAERRFPHAPDGAIVEICAAAEGVAAAIGARIGAQGGAGLFFDYGEWDGSGDTLQALSGGRFSDPLGAPGESDLTAHVRFRALAEASGVKAHGPVGQGVFLERVGITARAERLAERLSGAARKAVIEAHRRLTHPQEMGNLFKVMALTREEAPPPGFDA